MPPRKETETKSQWWRKTLLGTGGLGVIVVALLGLLNRGGGHNVSTGNISGNVAVGDHATVKATTLPPVSHVIPNLPQIQIETLDGLGTTPAHGVGITDGAWTTEKLIEEATIC